MPKLVDNLRITISFDVDCSGVEKVLSRLETLMSPPSSELDELRLDAVRNEVLYCKRAIAEHEQLLSDSSREDRAALESTLASLRANLPLLENSLNALINSGEN